MRRIGRGFGMDDETALVRGPRCYAVNGFSLHANRYIGQKERRKLEQLLPTVLEARLPITGSRSPTPSKQTAILSTRLSVPGPMAPKPLSCRRRK